MTATLTRWLIALVLASVAMGLVLVHAASAQPAAAGGAAAHGQASAMLRDYNSHS